MMASWKVLPLGVLLGVVVVQAQPYQQKMPPAPQYSSTTKPTEPPVYSNTTKPATKPTEPPVYSNTTKPAEAYNTTKPAEPAKKPEDYKDKKPEDYKDKKPEDYKDDLAPFARSAAAIGSTDKEKEKEVLYNKPGGFPYGDNSYQNQRENSYPNQYNKPGSFPYGDDNYPNKPKSPYKGDYQDQEGYGFQGPAYNRQMGSTVKSAAPTPSYPSYESDSDDAFPYMPYGMPTPPPYFYPTFPPPKKKGQPSLYDDGSDMAKRTYSGPGPYGPMCPNPCDIEMFKKCTCLTPSVYTKDGRGNCNVGASKMDLRVWCYVDPREGNPEDVCPDALPSNSKPGFFWSRIACITA